MTEKRSAFAELLQNFMWSQRPPLNRHQFATFLGVGRQTIYNWLDRGTRPQMQFIPLIAEKTGIPLRELYVAAGYPVSADGHLDGGIWTYIAQGVERAPDLDEATKQRVVQHIAELRAQYETREQVVSDDDNCRMSS